MVIAEPPITTLTRWEESGGIWRTTFISKTEAIVAMCTCYGERVDELRSNDPELLRYVVNRPRSDAY
jgi:hypothetical protein